MLTTLRNSSKNSILKIIFGSLLTILIISFGMWGTEDLVGVGKKQSTVATVGKLDISAKEFYSLYTRQTEEIRKLLGSSLDIKKSREFGYVDRALSSLVNRALFNNEALELGLSVSDINVRDKILKDDAFKDDLGQFSELQFRQLISESGYSEDTYVEGTRQDLAREQMVETIRSSLTIPKIMLKKLGEYNLQERSVDYFVIDVRNEKIDKIEDQFRKGIITRGERHNKIIDVWTTATDDIAKEVFNCLKDNLGKDTINPVYLMMDSGARGNRQQVRQLCGMRGLMAKPSGEIIEQPILYRMGLGPLLR